MFDNIHFVSGEKLFNIIIKVPEALPTLTYQSLNLSRKK